MHKFKAFLLSGFMAFLFAGGLLLGGSDFVKIPWGQFIAVIMWVVLLIMVKTIQRKHPNGPWK